MAATVYFVPISDWSDLDDVARRLAHLLAETPLLERIEELDLVGIKLTFGEAGNRTYPPAALIRELAAAVRRRAGQPFVTETGTLYAGRRTQAVSHLELAREHGFTHESVGTPIHIADGLRGREDFTVSLAGKHTQTAHLAPVVRDMDFLIGVAHMTGHLVEGFGGAMKNIGMGLASRAGKLDQHSAVCPSIKVAACTLCLACQAACPARAITEGPESVSIDAAACIGCADCLAVCPSKAVQIDWSREATQVQEATVEYALAVQRTLGGRTLYFNLLNDIMRHCDCMGETKDRLAPDIGILAAGDPVALDQASLDRVVAVTGKDVFSAAWPEVDPGVKIRHAETIGLGTSSYDLVTID